MSVLYSLNDNLKLILYVSAINTTYVICYLLKGLCLYVLRLWPYNEDYHLLVRVLSNIALKFSGYAAYFPEVDRADGEHYFRHDFQDEPEILKYFINYIYPRFIFS